MKPPILIQWDVSPASEDFLDQARKVVADTRQTVQLDAFVLISAAERQPALSPFLALAVLHGR